MIKPNQIAVIPTDTIYGVVGRAQEPITVERLYRLRRGNRRKPFIILISSLTDLRLFGVRPTPVQMKVLHKVWPGPISVSINNQAFRLPADKSLIKLLKKTGPLVAPSANPPGKPPAQTITEAKKYFGDKVDVYIDGGKLAGEPSALIKFVGRKIEIRRPLLHPDWQIVDGTKLVREFTFKDFKQAVAFVNKVMPIAERSGHHPDITINYNRVTLEIWTHSANRLTQKDFSLAYQIDQI